MAQVLVWKSDADGKLFEDKTKYTTHLRQLARQRLSERTIAKMNDMRDVFLIRMGQTVTSIAHLEEFIAENWEWFFYNGCSNALWRSDKRPSIAHKLVKIKIDVRWRNEVSNSHSCPRNGIQNWAQSNPENAHLPKGYPGWCGEIFYTVDPGHTTHKVPRKLSGYGSDYFKNTPIKTGCGSGGSKCSYDVKLFAADFPAMALARDQARVWAILEDKDVALKFV